MKEQTMGMISGLFGAVALLGALAIFLTLYVAVLATPGLALGAALANKVTSPRVTQRGFAKIMWSAVIILAALHALAVVVVPFAGPSSPTLVFGGLTLALLITPLIQMFAFYAAATWRLNHAGRQAIDHTSPNPIEDEGSDDDNDFEVSDEHGVDPIPVPGRPREETPTQEIPVVSAADNEYPLATPRGDHPHHCPPQGRTSHWPRRTTSRSTG